MVSPGRRVGLEGGWRPVRRTPLQQLSAAKRLRLASRPYMLSTPVRNYGHVLVEAPRWGV